MLKKEKTNRVWPTELPLDGGPTCHGLQYEMEKSLEDFKRKMAESYTVPDPARIEASKDFIRAVREFEKKYDADVIIQNGHHYVEAVFRNFGGSYPRCYCKDFAKLLSMCDRFDLFSSGMHEDSALFVMEFDTHDFYFGGKKFNENW